MVTLNGYFAGPHNEIDWHVVDEEFNHYAADMLGHTDLLMFGRTTYDLMAGYWPTKAARSDDPIVAGKMNSTPKIAFSTTLKEPTWANTEVVSAISPESIKNQAGQDILLLGSGTIVQTLTNFELIDEYRLMVNPVTLSAGKVLFANVGRLRLHLLKTRQFQSGNVLLCYTPTQYAPAQPISQIDA